MVTPKPDKSQTTPWWCLHPSSTFMKRAHIEIVKMRVFEASLAQSHGLNVVLLIHLRDLSKSST